jgi:uncharacterized protein (DUF362 family)
MLPIVTSKKICDIRNYENIRDGLKVLLDSIQQRVTIREEATIVIKANLCLLMGPETGATVDVRVARALIEWLRARYRPKLVYIAESDATHLDAEMAFRALGWRKYFQQWDSNVEFLNLSLDKRVKVKTFYGSEIEMSERYMNADVLISLAKLKTHSLQKMTCSMKNLFGALPEKYKIRYHNRLAKAICEIASARNPDISIIDGLVAMEGKGPVNGIPKLCKVLISGTDMVATDIYCAKLMGFKPKSVPHINEALRIGLGRRAYELAGDFKVNECLNFKFMSLWEEALRNVIKYARQRRDQQIAENAGICKDEV